MVLSCRLLLVVGILDGRLVVFWWDARGELGDG